MYKHIIIVVGLVLLIVGCSNPTVITINRTINHTIYKNNTIYINNTIIEPCNTTCPVLDDCPASGFNREYTLSLIRRVKFMEGQQDLYWNNTECYYDLNWTEVKLEECEDIMCNEWNSSWC